MSLRVAAGWSRPNCQSVSVVPMIHWSPHGSTKSTLFSVGRISAYAESMRSLGTTTWTPFDGRTSSGTRRRPDARCASVHTPVALTTVRARTSKSSPVSRSRALDAGDPVASVQEGDHVDGGGADGAHGHRRAGQHHREARVVDLGVVVADAAVERVVAQRRDVAQARGAREVTVARHGRPAPGEGVVEQEPRAHVDAVPDALLQGEEEGRRPDQVRGELLDQEPALVERLAHQPEVETLEVAEPPVDQLARAARGAGGEVALLDEGHGEAAGRGIESGAAAGHAAADRRARRRPPAGARGAPALLQRRRDGLGAGSPTASAPLPPVAPCESRLVAHRHVLRPGVSLVCTTRTGMYHEPCAMLLSNVGGRPAGPVRRLRTPPVASAGAPASPQTGIARRATATRTTSGASTEAPPVPREVDMKRTRAGEEHPGPRWRPRSSSWAAVPAASPPPSPRRARARGRPCSTATAASAASSPRSASRPSPGTGTRARSTCEGIGIEFEQRARAIGGTQPESQSRSEALDPELFKVVADALLREAGVEPLLHCLAVEPLVDDGRVTGVVTESKSGRQAILAGRVIDATGDADIAFRAGAPCRTTRRRGDGGRHGHVLVLGRGQAALPRLRRRAGPDLRRLAARAGT